MKPFIALLALLLAVVFAESQASPDSTSASGHLRILRPGAGRVLEGATLPLVLETAISSATSRSGDLVVARLAADVRVGEEVVVPSGTEVRGQVTGVVASGQAKGLARLAFDFDRLVLGGQEHTIGTRPVEIIAANRHEGDGVIQIGMGVGGIVGVRVEATGTGVVLTQKDSEVELGTGTVVTVRLTRETRL